MESLPFHDVPPPLAEFAASTANLEYNAAENEIILFHGTNCYRRWEINRSGFIEPGRNNYSFFCTRGQDAYAFARAACIRDFKPENINSLAVEPVVLKVKFTCRTWLQVDFLQKDSEGQGITAAVLGPIPVGEIVEVLHCHHGQKKMLMGIGGIRTFEGEFLEDIQHLKETLQAKRMDMWLLRKLGLVADKVGVTLKGGEVPSLTHLDQIRKLRQSNT
jgi:hypothetical protein